MNKQSLTISGPMTIYEVGDWRELFLHSLKSGSSLDVDLHTSGPWDTAGLQLLISLVNTGHQRDCEVRFHLVPKVCHDLARRAGLSEWLKKLSLSEL
jgi:ABC-type transporter Mla MlaB component